MKAFTSLLLLLSLVSLTLAVKKLTISHHSDDLHYYNKFEGKHSWTPNVHVPLQKHYANEKAIRQHLYKLEDQISNTKRAHGFETRDSNRAILAKEHEKNQVESNEKADVRLNDQREFAEKSEINHAEKFREKYSARFLKNKGKLTTALPDQRASYETLTKFDKDRVEHFTKVEMEINERLQKLKQVAVDENNKAQNEITTIEEEIKKMKNHASSADSKYAYRMTKLAASAAVLQSEVTGEHSLDVSRHHTQELESHATMVPEQKN